MKKLLTICISIFLGFLFLEIFFQVYPFFYRNCLKYFYNSQEFKFYAVGSSTTFGEPYDNKISFPKIVSYIFENRINNKKIKIYNLAEKGSTIQVQYERLFKEFYLNPPTKDSLIFIYAGLNDTLNVLQKRDNYIKNAIGKSTVLLKMYNLIYSLIYGKTDSYFAYEFYMHKIVNLTQSFGLNDIYVSTLVSDYKNYPLFNNAILKNDKYSKTFIEAKKALDNNEPGKAEIMFNNLLKNVQGEKNIDQNIPAVICYTLGILYEKYGLNYIANNFYIMSNDYEETDWKAKTIQNILIREISKKYNLFLIDAYELFIEKSDTKILDSTFMIDQHHPNINGYILIANLFADQISKNHKISKKNIDFNEQDMYKLFNFTNADLYEYVYCRGIRRIFQILATTDYNNIYYDYIITDRAKTYLEKSESMEFEDEYYKNIQKKENALNRALYYILLKDDKKAKYWLNKEELLSGNGLINMKTNFFTLDILLILKDSAFVKDNDINIKAGNLFDKVNRFLNIKY